MLEQAARFHSEVSCRLLGMLDWQDKADYTGAGQAAIMLSAKTLRHQVQRKAAAGKQERTIHSLTAALELIADTTANPAKPEPGPPHYRTPESRVLHLLSNTSERAAGDMLYHWHVSKIRRQGNPGARDYPEFALFHQMELALDLGVSNRRIADAAMTIGDAIYRRLGLPEQQWSEGSADRTPPRRALSFDIDDTINLGPESPGPVSWRDIADLQQAGYIIGSCSDREPSDQRRVWAEAGIVEAFAIPKELMWAMQACYRHYPAIHVGGSEERDRKPAIAQGVRFVQHSDISGLKSTLTERRQQ